MTHTPTISRTLMALAVPAILAAMPAAQAATVSYAFNTCLTGGPCGSIGSVVTTVATLDLKDIVGGVEFTLTGALGTGAFVSQLGFSQATPLGGTVGSMAATGSFDLPSVAFDAGGAALGDPAPSSLSGYVWQFGFSTSGSGGGIHRFDGGDQLKWTITGSGLDVTDFGAPAMVHVNEYITGQSAKLTTPVPEPETYAMFLAGLGLMGAVARRHSRRP